MFFIAMGNEFMHLPFIIGANEQKEDIRIKISPRAFKTDNMQRKSLFCNTNLMCLNENEERHIQHSIFIIRLFEGFIIGASLSIQN